MPRSYEAADPTRHFPSPDTETWRHFGDGYAGKVVGARLQGYDSSTLSYIDVVVDSTGQLLTASGAGGGGAATVADGADVAQGSTSDVAWVSGSGTLIAISKAEFAKLEAIRALLAGTLTVGAHNVTNAGTFAVQATGTVTANAGTNLNTSALALDATLTGGTQKTKLVDSAGTNAAAVSAAGAVKVDGSAVTQPVSLATNTPDVTDRAARLLGHVTVDSAPSTAVTNAGTFAVQAAATLAAETTKVIGTVNVAAAQTIAVTQATPANLAATVTQGPAAAASGAWMSKNTDGTNVAAVKAASTVVAATDPALVTAASPMRADAASLCVTNTAATGVACTLTIPSAGAGLFHYISLIEIQLYATAARTGGATPVLVTTTNLPGSPVWDFDTAQAIGNTIRQTTQPATPIKSSVANTATTIVAPIATTGIWRITAYYYAAP